MLSRRPPNQPAKSNPFKDENVVDAEFEEAKE
jgi:hypothetical protein